MRVARHTVALLLVGLVLAQAGCRKTSKLKREKPNVVLIVIDALRRDHVSAYGYKHKTTPVIDALAERGVLFENAIAQAPWTPSSMASMLTSRRPLAVGVHATEQPSGMRHLKKGRVTKLDDRHTTLMEVLEESGYATLCATANHLASDEVNFDQGCQKFVHRKYKQGNRADRMLDEAFDMLEKHVNESRTAGTQTPFFLWLHLMDVHEPNEPPPPYDHMYPIIGKAPHKRAHQKWGWYKLKNPGNRNFRIFKSHKVALYDGALTFVDAQIERFIGKLQDWRLADDTVLVIVSDHGEELWDHALFEQEYREDPRGHYGVGHGHTMFAEVLNVPLVIHGAGIPEGLRIAEQVRNVDIMPTILGLAEVTPNLKMEGVDLLAKIGQRKLESMLAFSEDITYGYEEKCVQDQRWKYIRGKDYEFLFDKQSDPREKAGVLEKHPAQKKRLGKLLDAILAGPVADSGEYMEMNEETLEHLRELGYID
jgi:arylsulfatase A-like enzyme